MREGTEQHPTTRHAPVAAGREGRCDAGGGQGARGVRYGMGVGLGERV